MSAPIGPGDWVECIRMSPTGKGDGGFLRVGALYCVDRVRIFVRGTDGQRRPALTLVGQPQQPRGAYRVDLFRPIYRRDETLLARLMQPVPGVETPSRVKEEA